MDNYEKVLELNPNSIEAEIMIGWMYSGSGRQEIGIEIFTELLAKHPRDPNLYLNRGFSYLSSFNTKSAIDDITKALEIDKEENKDGDISDFARSVLLVDPDIYYNKTYSNLCYAYMRQGDNLNALKTCDKAIELDPEDDESLFMRRLLNHR